MHWSVKQKNMCKPFQNHTKCVQGILLRGNEVSDAFRHSQVGVFMKNMRKCLKEIYHEMHDKNISTRCWSGESPLIVEQFLEHQNSDQNNNARTWRDVIKMQDRWRHWQALPDVTSCVIHCLLRALETGALETAQQSKGMRRYHESQYPVLTFTMFTVLNVFKENAYSGLVL
jgi:hypothetical protein